MVQLITSKKQVPTKGIVIIQYFAEWCMSCRKLAPLYDKLEKKYPEYTFLKANVDATEGDLGAKNEVSLLPTLYFFKDNVKIKEIVGVKGTDINRTLESLKG